MFYKLLIAIPAFIITFVYGINVYADCPPADFIHVENGQYVANYMGSKWEEGLPVIFGTGFYQSIAVSAIAVQPNKPTLNLANHAVCSYMTYDFNGKEAGTMSLMAPPDLEIKIINNVSWEHQYGGYRCRNTFCPFLIK